MARLVGGTQSHKNSNRHGRASSVLSRNKGGIVLIIMIIVLVWAKVAE